MKISGKTFSLQNSDGNSDEFYEKLSQFVDKYNDRSGSEKIMLQQITSVIKKKRYLKKISEKSDGKDFISQLLTALDSEFGNYIEDVEYHISTLTLRQRCNSQLSMSREQYLLNMVVIELTNRINKISFQNSDVKFAFLPHCLHDLEKICIAKKDELDYLCSGCSGKCYINNITKFLKSKNIKPYIWRTINLSSLFKKLKKQNLSIGVLGIACIPELSSGIKLCSEHNIPVIGIPLDANRCIRWMDDFYPTSTNLKKLEQLIN